MEEYKAIKACGPKENPVCGLIPVSRIASGTRIDHLCLPNQYELLTIDAPAIDKEVVDVGARSKLVGRNRHHALPFLSDGN
jgi:hypothetical protein